LALKFHKNNEFYANLYSADCGHAGKFMAFV